MSRYPNRSIGELERAEAVLEIQDGNHGELHPKTADYIARGIPFVMANNIDNDGVVDTAACNRISEDQANRLRIGFAKSGDVLLTHKATLGRTALLRNAEPFVMLTPQVTYYRTNEALLHNRFLVYAFREPTFQASMQAVGDQGTRK